MTTRILVLTLVTVIVAQTMPVATRVVSPQEERDSESTNGAIQALDAATNRRSIAVKIRSEGQRASHPACVSRCRLPSHWPTNFDSRLRRSIGASRAAHSS
jgi:hypothetical protein